MKRIRRSKNRPPASPVETFEIVEPRAVILKMRMPPGGSVVEPTPGDRIDIVDSVEAKPAGKTVPTISLKLTLESKPASDPVRLALGLYDLLTSVSRLDQSLGGAGLVKTAYQHHKGVVTLTPAPEKLAGAVERIRRIVKALNRAGEIPLPPEVRTMAARVA